MAVCDFLNAPPGLEKLTFLPDFGGYGAGWPGGAVYRQEGQLLWEVAVALGLPILEFGTNQGCSSNYMEDAADRRMVSFTTVDNKDDGWQPRKGGHKVIEDAREYARKAYEAPRFVYIDCLHEEGFCKELGEALLPKLGPGSVVAVHDVLTCPGDLRGVRAALGEGWECLEVRIGEADCGLAFLRRAA